MHISTDLSPWSQHLAAVFNVALIYALWSRGKVIIWLNLRLRLTSSVWNFSAQDADVSLRGFESRLMWGSCFRRLPLTLLSKAYKWDFMLYKFIMMFGAQFCTFDNLPFCLPCWKYPLPHPSPRYSAVSTYKKVKYDKASCNELLEIPWMKSAVKAPFPSGWTHNKCEPKERPLTSISGPPTHLTAGSLFCNNKWFASSSKPHWQMTRLAPVSLICFTISSNFSFSYSRIFWKSSTEVISSLCLVLGLGGSNGQVRMAIFASLMSCKQTSQWTSFTIKHSSQEQKILVGHCTIKLDVWTAGCNKSFQRLVFVLTQLHFHQWSSLPFCLPSLLLRGPPEYCSLFTTAHDCETGLSITCLHFLDQ